jgi:penicillin-binding protein-related factor A (putative recombinase)
MIMAEKPETALVKQIMEYLEYRGAIVTRVNSGAKFIKDEEKQTTRVFRGAKKGTSDIIGCLHGRYFAIEAKIKPNKPTLDQKIFLDKVSEAGGIAIVAYSLDDVDSGLGLATYR